MSFRTFTHQFIIIVVCSVMIKASGCPKACECKWKEGKEAVSCPGAGFIDIPRGLEPSTQILDLERNNLQILTNNAFVDTGLVNLQKVWLVNCNLKYIKEGAFNLLANLVEMDLSHNFLREIPSKAFKDVSGLRDLRVTNNSITSIPNEAFTTVPELVRLDLSNNKISSLFSKSFKSLTRLEVLKLSGNKLKSFPIEITHSLVALHGLHIDFNPWKCDCHIRPLREWMVRENVAVIVPPTCNFPPRLKGKKWFSLNLDEFVCIPQITAVAQRVLASYGDNVSLACLVETDLDAAVTWLVGDRPVPRASTSPVQRVRVSELISSKARVSNLTIAGADLQDEGIYRCIAENKAGRVETNLTLKVSEVISEVPLVAKNQMFVTGTVLGGLSAFFLFISFVSLVIYRRKKSHIGLPLETVKAEQSPVKRNNCGSTEYKEIPTSDTEDESIPSTYKTNWNANNSTCKSNGANVNKDNKISKNTRPEAVTVSYVNVPEARTPVENYVTNDLYSYKVKSNEVGGITAIIAGSNSKFPDLLNLYADHKNVVNDVALLQNCNSFFYTIPRRPQRNSERESREITTPVNETSFEHPVHRNPNPKTSSALELSERHPQGIFKRHTLLSSSLPQYGPQESERAKQKGGDEISEFGDPLWYEYHAQQLEKFLQEYKNLQEQLFRMKESCECSQIADDSSLSGPTSW